MTSQHSPEPVAIRDEMIRLGQLLKLANLVEDGLMAREVIAEGHVAVNGAVVTQRGKQIRPGDVIQFNGQAVKVVAE